MDITEIAKASGFARLTSDLIVYISETGLHSFDLNTHLATLITSDHRTNTRAETVCELDNGYFYVYSTYGVTLWHYDGPAAFSKLMEFPDWHPQNLGLGTIPLYSCDGLAVFMRMGETYLLDKSGIRHTWAFAALTAAISSTHVALGNESSILLHDLRTNITMDTPCVGDSDRLGLVLTNEVLIRGCISKRVFVFRLADLSPIESSALSATVFFGPSTMSYSDTDGVLACSHWKSRVKLFSVDAASGHVSKLHSMSGHTSWVASLVCKAGLVFSAGNDNNLTMWTMDQSRQPMIAHLKQTPTRLQIDRFNDLWCVCSGSALQLLLIRPAQ
eukprot:TRINITY_DN6553_c0_g1_i1.p1 TRINITY_DN6553_c0_g1~~TRINITY_DN6553_c0_g1_i1.p1  ORF type:complete len:388 (+),score=33.84 TRINITY_DN6553_c0_g1_i1:176-1165(+)